MKKISLLIIFICCIITSIFSQEVYTKTNVNLRYSPETGDNIILVIPQYTKIKIIDPKPIDDKWIKVEVKGKTGYLSCHYVTEMNTVTYKYETSETGNFQKNNYYTNTDGQRVQSPTYYSTIPQGATAKCKDGTYSFSRNRRGTCSHHGGVSVWY